MVDGVLFDKIEQIARNIRGDPRPFGGLQVSYNPSALDRADSSLSFLAIFSSCLQSPDPVNPITNSRSKQTAGPNSSLEKTCLALPVSSDRKKTTSCRF
jgi:hypothetical protein